MPNLDFYATEDDLDPIFAFILADGCEIFESYSVPERELRRYETTAQLREALRADEHGRLLLQLYHSSMRGRYSIERFDLKPGALRGSPAWRERISGWGLIQFYVCAPRAGVLAACHTNHNSAARASKWEATSPTVGPADAWDFREITRVSRRS